MIAERLRAIVRKITGAGYIDERLVKEVCMELRLSLLEADVSPEIAEKISKRVEERALKEKPLPGLTQRETLLKVIYDELVSILGEGCDIRLRPMKIMLVGLFGSGKTTTCGKLGLYFKKKGLRCCIVACDTQRAGAFEQAKQVASSVGVLFYGEENEKDACTIARNALEKMKRKADVFIFDTAGRDALDNALAEELVRLKEVVKPDEVMLVIPADIGKAAKVQAEEFNRLVGITGVIVTKLDSTARGGGALTACAAANARVKFICYGEKYDAIEEFNPKRYVSRLLGMGDIEAIVEKAKEAIRKEQVEKFMSGKFDLNDFKEQLMALRKMGSLSSIIEAIPGLSLGGVSKLDIAKQEEKLKKFCAIIDSMTKQERANPEIINESRMIRIAKGSGTRVEDVRELLNYYYQVKEMSKLMRDRRFMRLLRRFVGRI